MRGLEPPNSHLRELIALFQSHGVEFLVAGAHALALHGRPRFTEDLDLFLARSLTNASRVRAALAEFGLSLSDEAEHQLATLERGMITLGSKPNQVDLLNFLDGVEFATASSRAVNGSLAGLSVRYLSIEDYVATKRASGRARDLADLETLREALGKPLPGD